MCPVDRFKRCCGCNLEKKKRISGLALLDLGTIRLVTSVGLHKKSYTVSGRVSDLPEVCISENINSIDFRSAEQPWELGKGPLKPGRAVPVYTLQLKRVHAQRFAHDGLVCLCKAYDLAVTRACGSSEHLVRALLGLKQFDGSTSPKSASLNNILGSLQSQRRIDLLEWCEERLNKHLSSSQKELFLRRDSAISALHCAPGAGKTLLIEMLVLILAETTSTDSSNNQVKLVVTEGNVSMCSELHEGL